MRQGHAGALGSPHAPTCCVQYVVDCNATDLQDPQERHFPASHIAVITLIDVNVGQSRVCRTK